MLEELKSRIEINIFNRNEIWKDGYNLGKEDTLLYIKEKYNIDVE